MQILVIAATETEIAPFLRENGDADVLITGIGIAETLYHLLKRLHQMDYDMVIQAGIAGSFSEIYEPGSAVIVKQDCIADLGVNESNNFSTVFEMGLVKQDQFPYQNGWLINSGIVLDQMPLPKVKAITVNTIHNQEIYNSIFREKYSADIESMEGAALHYACLMEETNFLQLRTISNYIGERDKSKWKMQEAIDRLNKELNGLINALTNKISN